VGKSHQLAGVAKGFEGVDKPAPSLVATVKQAEEEAMKKQSQSMALRSFSCRN